MAVLEHQRRSSTRPRKRYFEDDPSADAPRPQTEESDADYVDAEGGLLDTSRVDEDLEMLDAQGDAAAEEKEGYGHEAAGTGPGRKRTAKSPTKRGRKRQKLEGTAIASASGTNHSSLSDGDAVMLFRVKGRAAFKDLESSEDLPSLETLMNSLHRVHTLVNSKDGHHKIALSALFTTIFNAWAAGQGARHRGYLRHTWALINKDVAVFDPIYFAARALSSQQHEGFTSTSPVRQLHLSSIITPFVWESPTTQILRILVPLRANYDPAQPNMYRFFFDMRTREPIGAVETLILLWLEDRFCVVSRPALEESDNHGCAFKITNPKQAKDRGCQRIDWRYDSQKSHCRRWLSEQEQITTVGHASLEEAVLSFALGKVKAGNTSSWGVDYDALIPGG